MEASRRASRGLWVNRDGSGNLPIFEYSFILDREVDSVATEDERRFGGSCPVFRTLGWFCGDLRRANQYEIQKDPVTWMMRSLETE